MKTSLLLTTLTLTLAVSASRADDTLDRVLAQNAETVLDQLRGQEFNNVGILKFELQRGGPNGPIYLNVGRIHEAGATMLENVLAFANPLEKPIGITHAASAVAIEHDPDASYRSAATRRKLFQEKYPLAWGDAKVQVDAFIVGRVTIADDLKGASLSLRYVTAKNPGKWHNLKLKKETVTVTPALLSDINQSFAVGSFVSKTRGGDDALVLNDPAFALVLGEGIKVEPSPNDTVEKKPIEPEVVQVPKVSRTEMVTTEEIAVLSDKLTIKLYYDDVEVKRSADDIFPTPQPGQKIHITLKANSKLGVVLMINGINTADYDPANRNVNDYTKWILEPGTLYTIEGYFGDGRKIPLQSPDPSRGTKRPIGLGRAKLSRPNRHSHLRTDPGERTTQPAHQRSPHADRQAAQLGRVQDGIARSSSTTFIVSVEKFDRPE